MTAGWEFHRYPLADTVPHGGAPSGFFQKDADLGPTENLRRVAWRMSATFAFAGGIDQQPYMWPVGSAYAQITVGDQIGNSELIYQSYRPLITDVWRMDASETLNNYFFSGHVEDLDVDLQISRSFSAYGGGGLRVSIFWQYQLYAPNFVLTLHPEIEARGQLVVLGRQSAA